MTLGGLRTTMTTGYSGTPLAKKLGIKAGQRVALVNAPRGFESTLEGLPESAALERVTGSRPATQHGLLIVFVNSVAELAAGINTFVPTMPADASLWVAWPKKASGIQTDMTEDRVREVALPLGLVDNKVCAIDATWSGLRLVVRKERRAGWPAAFARGA
jgi:hypothetical protein